MEYAANNIPNDTGVNNSTLVSENALYEPNMSSQDVKEKAFTFRKLNSTDLFPMIKIISKIGLDELTQVFDGDLIKNIISTVKNEEAKEEENEEAKEEENEEAKEEENEEAKEEKNQFVVGVGVALKLANKILEHIPSCESEIYKLLSNVSGMAVDEIKTLDLDVFLEMILEFVMKEEFKRFFKVASKYIK